MENSLLPFITEFWTRLGIVTTSMTVETLWEDINIRVETPDSALLIGMHGKNIEALQHLLGRMLEKKVEWFIHVHLEVNDYMKQKDEKLFRFLDSKISLVTSSGIPVRMASLTPYERKKAHSYIADKHISWLSTQSEWEWIERALVLSYNGESPILPTHITTPKNSPNPEELLSDDGVGI
jgi:predicted RNA-binding protein Jag